MLQKLFSTHLARGAPALTDLRIKHARVYLEGAELLSCSILTPVVKGPRNY